MRRLRDLNLADKIYRLSGTVIIFFLAVICWLGVQFRESLYEARRHEIKNIVETAWNTLDFNAREAASGILTPEEARRRALQALYSQRLDHGNYFWVCDLTPRMVMHPHRPDLEGELLADYLDPDGRALFQEMADTVRRDGAGFVSYLWPKPGSNEPVRKISYVKGFPEWGWFVGTGYYMDDMDGFVRSLVLTAGSILTIVIISAVLLVTYVGASISVPMGKAVKMIEALESGDLNHRLRFDQMDEVGRLGNAMDAFADNLQHEVLTAFDRLSRGDFTFQAEGLIRVPLAQTNARLNGLVAELHTTAAREREERARYFSIFNENYAVMLLIDPGDGQIVDANPSACAFYGYSPQELIGKKLTDINVLPQDELSRQMEEASRERRRSHFRHRLANEQIRDVEVYSGPIEVQGRTLLFSIVHDISERMKAEERVQFLAFHDSLTGLSNRAYLEDRLQQTLSHAIRHKESGGLFFLDLDRFKVINDSLGHHAGDLLLKEVGKRLKERLRGEDTICRQGGDEFILLLPQLKNASDAAHLAEEILKLFCPPFMIEGREVFLTPSIGISLYPGDAADMTTLIKNADAAMYLAKERGRNNYQFFRPELTVAMYERLALENELRQVLSRGELALQYQPQVDAVTNAVIGVEALVRWVHPKLGIIPPAKFIPIAEESGLIDQIGTWVLRTACMQNKEWQDLGFAPVRMAVNVSGRQFRQAEFIRIVDGILEAAALDPQWLELEVTENILMEDADQTTLTLALLKLRGVSLAIDDFGTGYSSLSYLRQFPIDRLKIDRSFVADVTSNSDAAAIVDAIISLAEAMNLEVIAEGVETAEQAKLLRDRHCHALQGYFCGSPSSPDGLVLPVRNRLAV